MSTLRLTGSTSGYTEVTAPAVAGSNTLVLPSSNGSAHQLLKNSGTAGTLEYGVTLPSGNGLAHQLVKNSSSAGTWEYGFTLPSGNGTADQALVTDGSGTLSFADRGRMVLETAKASTSGTEVDFTDIPSWVKRVTVMLNGVSTNGTSPVIVQLGDSGGVENTGYVSQAAGVSTAAIDTTRSGTNTDGFRLAINVHAASDAITGKIDIVNISSNTWIAQGIIIAAATFPTMTVGSKTTSATLDRVRITTVGGTDTFDAGSINILYEG